MTLRARLRAARRPALLRLGALLGAACTGTITRPARLVALLAAACTATITRPALRLGALLAAAFIATMAPAPVHAEPADLPLSLPALGMGKSLTFPGAQHKITLTVPVLPGLAPTALVGTIQLPPHVARWSLEVESEHRLIDRVDLPAGPPGPIRLSLAGATVVHNAMTVTLTSALIAEPGWCVTDWFGTPLTLLNPAINYFGEEVQPGTIADFLPPVLQRLTIYVPAEPSQVESAGALTLGTAVVARYGGQPVVVDLRPVPPGGPVPDHPPALLERQVVIAESDETGLRMESGPVLRISGSRDTLPDQLRLLATDLTKVAIASAATAINLPPAPQLAADSTTLSALGQNQLSATSIGAVRVDIGLDQSRLGRASRDVRLRLLGNYTPLANTMNGQISVTVGDRQIDRWPTTADGSIDRWIDIPNEVLGRFTTVSVTLQQSGLTHGCGFEQPLTLTIDPGSEVTSAAAAPPIPPGFDSLPPALLPTVQVGMRTPGFADTVRAVTILTGLQRFTTVPMRPELVTFDDAARSKSPALLIAANGDVPASIDLPLHAVDGRLTLVDANGTETVVAVHPLPPMGSLQTTWSGGRTVVVATSTGAPEHLDRALDWLKSDPIRWTYLQGSVLYQSADREPQWFVPPPAVQGPSGPQSSSTARILTLAGFAALAVGVLAAAVLLFRRGSR